jgi:uncharacterized protein
LFLQTIERRARQAVLYSEVIEQGAGKRIAVLDVLRGVAILGILLANITAFATPLMTSQFALSLPDRSSAERVFDSVVMAFVNGKFRSLLAILFGVGLWMQYERRKAAGTWPKSYLKRLGWLLLIGLLHGYLIWYGDILSTYAVVAAVTMVFLKSEDKTLWWLIGVLALNAVLTAAVLVPLMLMFFNSGEAREWDVGSVWPMFSQAGETAAYQSGSWLTQLGYRAVYYTISLTNAMVFGLVLLPLFLFGVILARHRVLEAPSKHPKYGKWCLIIGFGLGLPLSLISFVPMAPKVVETLQIAVELVVGPLLALGYLMAIAIWVEKGRSQGIAKALGQVGRVALSAYILQSLVCTFIFYSWGLGLFGKLQPLGWLSVVAIAWVIDLVFAHLWLRSFSIGPIEWLWRSLTEGRRLPLRRAGSERL